ncbi:hypothetical protein M569_11418 [Genlisea aurea]|uniref:Pentacotripeptide-repeat region of PRORP domain-containing protein n=1 Tax=Genlisea aurea TaxID=192259 RepID=S8DU52_9LAMI|nr:hypothetical protein M569_11418 [Genlisea aurea]
MLFHASSIRRYIPAIAGKFSDLAIRSSPFFSGNSSSAAEIFIAQLLKDPNNVEKTLDSVKAKLDARCITQVLATCARSKSQLCLRFFIWAGLHPTHRHTPFMYHKACELLDVEKNPRLIIDLMDGYSSEGFLVSIKMFKSILNLCKAAKDADLSLLVLRKMKEFNCRPDTVCYNVVIRLLVDKGSLDEAMAMMKEMGLIDLYPDNITYVSILKGLCDSRRLTDAFSLVDLMKVHGCVPNSVLYSTLLDGVCNCENPETAFDFLKLMEGYIDEGIEYKPNVVAYTSIVKRLSEKGKSIEAIQIIDRMDEEQIKPNRVTFAALLDGLCRDGHVEEAHEAVNRFNGKFGFDPDKLYSLLAMALFRTGKLRESEELLMKMVRRGMRPNGLAAGTVVRAAVSDGRPMDGYVLLDALERSGNLWGADSETCSVLLAALCSESRFEEARKVFDIMKEASIRFDCSRAESVFEHLHACGEYDLVSSISGITR